MQNLEDLRVRKTRELIKSTMIDLISEKGFDAVSVGDIAKRAMINRSTFYRHYSDKYDLVRNIFQNAVEELLAELGSEKLEMLGWAMNMNTHTVNDNSEMQGVIQAWIAFFGHFRRHEKFYKAMIGKQGSSWFSIQLSNYTASVLNDRFKASPWFSIRQINSTDVMPTQVAVASLANWIISMIVWWIEDGTKYSPTQIAIWSLQCVCQGYVSALGINVTAVTEEGF